MPELDTSVPRWFQDASSWYSSEQRVQQNDIFNVKMQESFIQIQKQKEELENQKLTNERVSQDLSNIPKWMRDHPTWQSRQDAQWPTPLTPQGDRMVQEQRLRDSQSIQAETAIIATHDFATRVAKLRDLDPEAAGQFAPYISQKPSPIILQALSVAEATAKLHAENIAEAARIDAEAAGQQVRTVTGTKGTTVTATTPKPATVTKDIMPVERTLSDGSKVIVNPKSGTFKFLTPQGKEDKPNSAQLRLIAKDIETTRPEDYNVIMDILMKRSTNAPAASKAIETPAPPKKIKMISPGGVTGFVPADQVDRAKGEGYKLAP